MDEKHAFRFPFGRPVLPRRPTTSSPARLFVLGAYPSALHVRWKPPGKARTIRALAVDNEPEPFWNGDDASARIEAWKQAVEFRREWGDIQDVGRLNGSSGVWVDHNVLEPLRVGRAEAYITDCLDLYHASKQGKARLDNTYTPFAEQWGMPQAHMPSHPSEDAIVAAALGAHLERLRAELAAANPERVVTLGNAALRVFAALVTAMNGAGPGLGLSIKRSGERRDVRLPNGKTATWIPLAHPAAPLEYKEAHIRWSARRSG